MSIVAIILLTQTLCFVLFVIFSAITNGPHKSFTDFVHNVFAIDIPFLDFAEFISVIFSLILLFALSPFALLYLIFSSIVSLIHKTNPNTDMESQPTTTPNIIRDFVPEREYQRFPMQNLFFDENTITFTPHRKELIYIDREPDSDISQFISQHFDDFSEYVMKETGCRFINLADYITELNAIDAYKYICPHSTDSELSTNPIDARFINEFIDSTFLNHEIATRGFIFYPSASYSGGRDRFAYFNVPSREVRPVEHLVQGMCLYIKDTHPFYSLYHEQGADANFGLDVEKMMTEITERVKILRQRGVTEAIIASLFKSETKLSRLHITADFNIILPDYNNMEIHLTPLPKAVYFLFLRHPEGILFKNLPDYYDELLDIYTQLTGRKCDRDITQSIKDVTDPTKNSINEKCARIKEAFVTKFHDTIAQNYFITGKRGEPKTITLPRDLVDWTFNL